MGRDNKTLLRKFHQARWDEEIIFEMSVPGERGVLIPKSDPEIVNDVGDGLSGIPDGLRRKAPPALPEMAQMRVLRHFMRLSQETMGADIAISIGEGTCTMKYSPKVQEHLAARHPGITEIHPLQDEDTLQGILEIYHKLEQFLKEVSGLDHFSLQPSAGTQAIYANACIIRAYHETRGDRRRDEVITTILSQPGNAAAPAAAGYKVITLMPGENGYPDIAALKEALSERTAGLFITNPEDTGIYNPKIDEYVKAAHDAGALCAYDQANANGLLGIARAKESGFDLCHFNVHKTFSAPHGCSGPAMGALGATAALERYLPVPRIAFDGKQYHLDYNYPDSIGRLRSFFGNAPIAMKAYAWIMQHGADGLREVAKVSILNHNYLDKQIREIPGVVLRYAKGKRRLEQARYSWEKLMEDTGVSTDDVERRMLDYGLQHYFTSHHPVIVPEPFTPEACETYSKDDIDEFAAVMRQISKEAYENPELVKQAPHNGPIHHFRIPVVKDVEKMAPTWRRYKKITGIA
ncbi:MAG: aminomethyl-transferring glycine dehydrogenase subunit GcvPB [Deltaproteobacteria bacterium]|nr:aminomethyl-transferring glycine dehydrogenase subunit GcvPB [Deltaproteobacteria bacterium]